jgi:ectoine hydroxylase-related dioxygenase (phytanoyl-CoA dioxygenase family)
MNFDSYSQQYARDGFLSGIDILSPTSALQHRQALENAESKVGSLHYKTKVHTILKSAYDLAVDPGLLDIVELCIGPDVLLYNVTYIIKEPHSESHVSWHQDLTYWGFSSDDQVSVWLALSPATRKSGCMKMIPASHRQGKVEHRLTDDESNVLLSGQTIREVDESLAVLCGLEPGQASFHHGWTQHASTPNLSDDRRIGLNMQFVTPRVKQLKQANDSAILVRGEDRYHHFKVDVAASADLDPEAMIRQTVLEQNHRKTASARQ